MIRTRSEKKSLSTLIKEADNVFSELVRRSRADDNGKIKCLICGAVVRWQDADAAHCFDRDHMATRYDLLNVWPTDQECNRFDDDHRNKYHEALRKMIDNLAYMEMERKSRSLQKFMPFELEELIATWKERLRVLK